MSERLQPEFDTIEYTFRQVCRLVQMAKRDAAFLANDHHFHEAQPVCLQLVEFATRLEMITQKLHSADLVALMSGFAELQPMQVEGSPHATTNRIEEEAAFHHMNWNTTHVSTQAVYAALHRNYANENDLVLLPTVRLRQAAEALVQQYIQMLYKKTDAFLTTASLDLAEACIPVLSELAGTVNAAAFKEVIANWLKSQDAQAEGMLLSTRTAELLLLIKLDAEEEQNATQATAAPVRLPYLVVLRMLSEVLAKEELLQLRLNPQRLVQYVVDASFWSLVGYYIPELESSLEALKLQQAYSDGSRELVAMHQVVTQNIQLTEHILSYCHEKVRRVVERIAAPTAEHFLNDQSFKHFFALRVHPEVLVSAQSTTTAQNGFSEQKRVCELTDRIVFLSPCYPK